MKVFLLRILSLLLLLCRGILVVLALFFCLAILSQFNENMTKNKTLNGLLKIEQTLSKPVDPFLRALIPRIYSFDATNLAKLVICLMLSSYVYSFSGRLLAYNHYFKQKKELDIWRNQGNIAENNSLFIEMENKLEQISKTKDKNLARKLHMEFMEIKKKLESQSRYLAFLSMDVVDSTGMKTSEDKSMIQLDFFRFKRMIQKVLDKHGCVKSAWTPDGVMVCFDTVENAVSAAKESLFALKKFNSEEKQISRDFAIRCGIHAGNIYYDDQLPLEEITDQVIDIAGHMQKHADPGTIAISKMSIKPIENTIGFKDAEKKVDELEVYSWGLD